MPSPARHLIESTKNARSTPRIDRDTLETALACAVAKVRSNAKRWRGRFPSSASASGRYACYTQDAIVDADAWTAGFWPGLLWLSYEATGDVNFRVDALSYVPLFEQRLARRIWVDHHDLGFLYSLSCVAAYRLSGDPSAKSIALRAADLMLERYHPNGRFIQAWGPLDDRTAQRLIIDSLMNLPLLFWASEVSGRDQYRVAAEAHLRTTLAHTIRPDASTFHTFYVDAETGAPSHGVTRQGFSDSSCWARGQAWAIYGIPLAARYVVDSALFPAFTRVTEYFLTRLPTDAVCYWDLVFTEGPQERDSSAAAIAACGLLESVRQFPPGELRAHYETAAHRILHNLIENYAASENADGLLLHGVYSKPHNAGVDECCIWGDYFYLEALVRLQRDWAPYW